MLQLKLNQVADAETVDSRWHWLYKFGGAADAIRWAACRGTNSNAVTQHRAFVTGHTKQQNNGGSS